MQVPLPFTPRRNGTLRERHHRALLGQRSHAAQADLVGRQPAIRGSLGGSVITRHPAVIPVVAIDRRGRPPVVPISARRSDGAGSRARRVIARPRPGQRSPNAIPTPIGGTSPPRDTSSIISSRSRCRPGGCGRRDPRRRFRRPGALPALSQRRLGNRATAGGRAIAMPRTRSRGATRPDESNGDRGDVRPWLVKPQTG